jgi:hypothetical protein
MSVPILKHRVANSSPNSEPPNLFLYIKFYWHSVMSIYLLLSMAAFVLWQS